MKDFSGKRIGAVVGLTSLAIAGVQLPNYGNSLESSPNSKTPLSFTTDTTEDFFIFESEAQNDGETIALVALKENTAKNKGGAIELIELEELALQEIEEKPTKTWELDTLQFQKKPAIEDQDFSLNHYLKEQNTSQEMSQGLSQELEKETKIINKPIVATADVATAEIDKTIALKGPQNQEIVEIGQSTGEKLGVWFTKSLQETEPVANNPVANNQIANNQVANKPVDNSPVENNLVENTPVENTLRAEEFVSEALNEKESIAKTPEKVSPEISLKPAPIEKEENLEELETESQELPELEVVSTSAPDLLPLTSNPEATGNSPEEVIEGSSAPTEIAQSRRRRRQVNDPQAPWSYVSAGINLGLGGGTTDLGETSFAFNGKIPLSSQFSVRPAVLLGERTAFLIPVTYDFQIPLSDRFERGQIYPFAGGGLFFTTENEETQNNLALLLSGGIDLRLSEKLVVNTGLNVGFLRDQTEFGLLIGIGYIFRGF